MKNKLEDQVRSSILHYPTLYRAKNYEDSKILVYNQLFCTIGNGYEWDKDGTLHSLFIDKTSQKIPADFFKKKLWCFDFKPKMGKQLKAALENHFFYFTNEKMYGNKTVVFEGTKKFAQQLCKKYEAKEGIGQRPKEWLIKKNVYVQEAGCYLRDKYKVKWLNEPSVCVPYPMCDYSAIVEMVNGRTNSPHIENFDLEPRADWLEGAKEMVEYVLSFYQNEELCKHCHYHPSQSIPSMQYDYNAYKKKKKTKTLKEWRKVIGWMSGTIPQRCNKSWKRFQDHQIKICRDFIAKYGHSQKDGVPQG